MNVTPFPTIGGSGFFDASNPAQAFGKILASAFTVILVVGGLWAFFMLVTGGFAIISSGGDQQAIEKGRGKIMWALIGIVILAASWGLIVLIQGLTDTCFGFGCEVNLDALSPS